MPYRAFDLTGKVALISGGNGVIGLGMACGLAEAGASVVIWGTDPEKNAAAIRTLRTYGGQIDAAVVDVSDEHAVVAGVAAALSEFGRLDTVIANAGVGGGSEFGEFPTELWRRVMAVNLDGVFFLLREACKHMVARAEAGYPGGSLVAISSTSAIHGAAKNEAYGAAKGALCSLIRAIAVEHARYGIRANAILPGWTRSEMTQALQQNEKFERQVISRVPFREWMEPKDFAGLAIYLTSDASRFHTGDSFVLDAGYTIY
jgi:NAD(P)-dependent dehydrogenase (short-subunit alcohol dehydrogenase family)